MRTDLKTTPQLTSNQGGALGVPTAPTRPNGPASLNDQLVQKVQLTGASCPAVLERRRENQKGHRKDKVKDIGPRPVTKSVPKF